MSPLARTIDPTELDRLAVALKAAKLHGTKVKNACTVHLPVLTEALGGGSGNLGRLVDPDTLKSLRYLATNVSTLRPQRRGGGDCGSRRAPGPPVGSG